MAPQGFAGAAFCPLRKGSPGLTEVFEAERERLFAIAYRMLGSVADAEDVVQDVWLAWQHVDPDELERPAAYLTRMTTNRCLDTLRAARRHRETYVGPWLPEPLLATDDDAAADVELAESVRVAFLVALESLSPAERAALVLRDAFGYPYGELAGILDRSEDACRQLVARARRHVQARRPGEPADPARAAEVAERFLAAAQHGDIDGLLAVLHPDAELVTDSGGKVSAARRTVTGADRIARFVTGVTSRALDGAIRPVLVNAAPGAIMATADGPAVVSIEIDGDRVTALYVFRNPEKLTHVHPS